MSRNRSHFHPEEFLSVFENREGIIEQYLDSIPAAGITVERPVEDTQSFVDHLETCSSEERNILMAGLIEAFEMTSDEGHEQLLQALRQVNQLSRYRRRLPAECLALHLLSTHRSLFETALSLDEIRKCDALHLFKPQSEVALVEDLDAATNAFRGAIAESCNQKYGSRRVLLRRFHEGGIFTIGFYFEKAPKAQRQLAGSSTDPSLQRQEARPLQFDLAIFEEATGLLSIRSGYGRLTSQIRRAFAATFLNDSDAYEWAGANQILDLNSFFDPDSDMLDIDDEPPVIVEVDYTPANDFLNSRYVVRGDDVLEVLRRDENLNKVFDSNIKKVTLKMAMESMERRRRVVLTNPNKLELNRKAEADRILEQLIEWDVLDLPQLAQAAV